MWAIIKFDQKKLEHLKKDISNKLGNDFKVYNPKLLIQKYKKNKLVKKEFNLLGDYLFCYHKDFKNPLTLKKIQFCKGENMFQVGPKSQSQINEFIKKCRPLENKEGFLSPNFKFAINKIISLYCELLLKIF